MAPPVALMTRGYVPRTAVGETLSDSVVVPVAVPGRATGAKDAVTPLGRPETEKPMREIKPA